MKEQAISVSDPRAGLSAIRTLTVGGVALLPTDTLYGLHVLATLPGSTEQLAELKGYEDLSRGFILLVDRLERVEAWAEVDESDRRFMEEHWPGPVSMILRAREDTPDEWVTVDEAGIRRVAFRVPNVPFINNLLEMLAEPLLSTSANLAGEPPLESAEEIVKLFGDKVDLIVTDPDLENRIRNDGALPSALVDLSRRPPIVLREGKDPLALSLYATPE